MIPDLLHSVALSSDKNVSSRHKHTCMHTHRCIYVDMGRLEAVLRRSRGVGGGSGALLGCFWRPSWLQNGVPEFLEVAKNSGKGNLNCGVTFGAKLGAKSEPKSIQNQFFGVSKNKLNIEGSWD